MTSDPASFASRIRLWVDRNPRLCLALIIVCGALLHAPSLLCGFYADDYSHLYILDGHAAAANVPHWDLFDFGQPPRPGEWRFEAGILPWWTSPDWKVSYFRPLTSLLESLDHSLYGTTAAGYGLSSLLYYALLLLLAHGLYRRLELPRGTAFLALGLLAVQDSTVLPVSWVASRSSLLTVLLTVAAMLVLVRFQRSHRALAFSGALVLAAFACMAKESGIVAFPLIAWWLQRSRRGTSDAAARRWANAASVAALLPAFVYVAFLWASDYGVHSVFNAAQWTDPALFLARAGKLLTVGVLSLISPLPLDPLFFIPRIVVPGIVLGACIVPVFVWHVWPRIRNLPGAGFLLAWSVLTLLPSAFALLSGRLMLGPAVGSSGLLALYVTSVWSGAPAGSAIRLGRVLSLLVFLSAGPLSALAVPIKTLAFCKGTDRVREILRTAEVGSEALGQREVFLLQSPTPFCFIKGFWSVEMKDTGVRFWPMQFGRRAVRWRRIDERSFELESAGKPFMTGVLEEAYLSSKRPIAPTTRWRTPLFSVGEIEPSGNGLRSFRVSCSESLDNPRIRFLTYRHGRMRALPPPPIGQSIDLPAVVPPMPFMP